MTLRRDNIKRGIEGLSNDERQWNTFTIDHVSQAAHDAVAPEFHALNTKIATLESGSDNELQEMIKKLESDNADKDKQIADLIDASKHRTSNSELEEKVKALEATADETSSRETAIHNAITQFLSDIVDATDFADVSKAAKAFADSVEEHNDELTASAKEVVNSIDGD